LRLSFKGLHPDELLLGISGEEFMLTTAPIRLAQPHDQPAA
jgi:hypothetical protein